MKTFQKPLTTAEENLYLQRCQEGDSEAKNILIERNLRLVAHVVKKYQSTGEDLDDLISVGTIGLIKAISTFDCTKRDRLATNAARCIDHAILSQMRLWFQINPPTAEKNQSGVFWHRVPRMFTSFVLLRMAM